MSATFIDQARVYIEDTDAGGIVYHANYLKYMERARSDWLRTLGLNQQQLQEQGVLFVVRRCEVDYLAPAHLDDDLTIVLALASFGRASITFSQKVLYGEDLLCRAMVKVACVSVNTSRPVALPETIYQQLKIAEAEDMKKKEMV